jgi:THO complex subunit 4
MPFHNTNLTVRSQNKKDKPKPATAAKAAPATAGRGRGRGGKAEARGGRAGGRERTKKKTVEELDAEMADYFPAGEGNAEVTAVGGAEGAQTAAVGDTAMDDEML